MWTNPGTIGLIRREVAFHFLDVRIADGESRGAPGVADEGTARLSAIGNTASDPFLSTFGDTALDQFLSALGDMALNSLLSAFGDNDGYQTRCNLKKKSTSCRVAK